MEPRGRFSQHSCKKARCHALNRVRIGVSTAPALTGPLREAWQLTNEQGINTQSFHGSPSRHQVYIFLMKFRFGSRFAVSGSVYFMVCLFRFSFYLEGKRLEQYLQTSVLQFSSLPCFCELSISFQFLLLFSLHKGNFKRLSIFILIVKNREFDGKIPSKSFSKCLFKYSRHLFRIFCQLKIDSENGSLECK